MENKSPIIDKTFVELSNESLDVINGGSWKTKLVKAIITGVGGGLGYGTTKKIFG